jgi:hypothetical protein
MLPIPTSLTTIPDHWDVKEVLARRYTDGYRDTVYMTNSAQFRYSFTIL